MLGPTSKHTPNHLLSNISPKFNLKSPPTHMASPIFNPTYSSHPSSIFKKPPIYASLSISQFSCSRTLTIRSLNSVSNLGLAPFSSWNGLRKNGFSISVQSLKLEKRKKCKGNGVFASLFGVGAPEALVIGVVALLVFGPKGLADVAKNLGQTLRAFQPTIRELQEVSREFKSTLEKEIGLDEIKNPVQQNYTSNTVRPPPSSQIPPELTATPPETTTTEDSQETVTTPGDSSEDPQETSTTAVSLDDSQETITTPAVSSEDSQETTVTPAVTMDNSQATDDTTNGKAYSSEDLLKITEEQLKAVASQQQKEQIPSPTPSEKSESEI